MHTQGRGQERRKYRECEAKTKAIVKQKNWRTQVLEIGGAKKEGQGKEKER